MFKRKNTICLIMFFLIIGLLFSTKSFAKEDKIRVGFFPLSGFQEYNEKGEPSGYNVEYLEKISEYTGWEYEYVHADSWVEALKMLDKKEIDLLAPSQKTVERQKKYLISDYSFGTEYGVLMTWEGNDKLLYEDFESFSDIRIGCVESFVMKDSFYRFAEKNKFVPNIKYFYDTNELLRALNSHQVDAVIANFAVADQEKKVLARFAPKPYYYMTYKENEQLMDYLDAALDKLQSDNPDFSVELSKFYYPETNLIPFTKKEQEYIQEIPTLRVGIMMYEPLAYIDKKNKITGILVEIMDKISQISGLRFEYVPLIGQNISYDDIRMKKISLIAGVENTKINKDVGGMEFSNPFFFSQKVLVGRKGIRFSSNANFKIALSTGSLTLEESLKEKYSSFEITNMSSTEKCLDAVLEGDADIMIHSQYAVEKLLVKPKYEKLIVIPDTGLEEQLSVVSILYSNESKRINPMLADSRLMSIVNKAIDKLDKEEVRNIIISYTAGNPYKFTLEDFIYKYFATIVIILVLTILGIGIAVYAARLQNETVSIIRNSEKELSFIANNINGGVVVLIPDKGFFIKYANSGFAKMLGAAEEYKSILTTGSYITYIHESDIPKLNSLMIEDMKEGESIELELQIRRLDGEYIPALFKGTLARDENSVMLYCVVMDIREQKRMLDEMEEEKERYAMVVEQSNDVIFDVDLERQTVLCSSKYEKVFGWKLKDLPKNFQMKNLHIYEKDIEKTIKMEEEISNEEKIEPIRIRIKKADGKYIWCNITVGAVKRKEKTVRLVGKITNVDEQVKEYNRLESLSRVDGLTGLLKKEAFCHSVENFLQSHNNKGNNILLFIDLDNFKKLNDRLGHQCGDIALKDVAATIQKYFDKTSYIGRFGGDEFFVFSSCIYLQEFLEKLEKLRTDLQKKYVGDNDKESVSISASMGFSYSEDGRKGYDELLEQADTAVYGAKKQGKNRYVMYHDGLRENSK